MGDYSRAQYVVLLTWCGIPLFIIRLSIVVLMHMINVMIMMISITTRGSSTAEPM